jgi:sigma-B regulation protein RsbU (phosphoserine phosphatase)
MAWDAEPKAINEMYTRKAVMKFNRMACNECQPGEFITLFFAILDGHTQTLTYCSCGHEPTVLIRNDTCMDLKEGGLVLGVDPQAEYRVATLALKPKDGLLFYTDGLIDAVNFDGDIWSRECMLNAARKGMKCTAEHAVGNILRYRRRFVGLARQLDDTSLIVIKVKSDVATPAAPGDCVEPLAEQ